MKYKKVFANSSDPILLFDIKGRVIDYNKAALNFINTPTHRGAHVHEQIGPEVGLLLELLDIIAVRTRPHAPVDVAEVVARLVGAQLGELGREPAVR